MEVVRICHWIVIRYCDWRIQYVHDR
jgi:hypothetical protein